MSSSEGGAVEQNPLNKVRRVIGVMSGKGGVGKSTVAVMLSRALQQRGYKTGILDADITGPSIPRLLGIRRQKIKSSAQGLFPVEAAGGIKVISLNLLINDENQPVIWRGPLIANATKQFWTDVIWGELDYLVIDLPPGTGDVALTVMQSIPLDGMIIVSVPQDMVSMIVSKAVNMIRELNVEVLGVVENMSYFICPHCGERSRIFQGENTDQFLRDLQIKLLGELPLNSEIAALSSGDNHILQGELKAIVDQITDAVEAGSAAPKEA